MRSLLDIMVCSGSVNSGLCCHVSHCENVARSFIADDDMKSQKAFLTRRLESPVLTVLCNSR